MAPKKIEGYWDCAFCDTKGILGHEKVCPCCGKPRGEDVIFYMKDTKNYVKEENKKDFNGESWYCSYCDTLNEKENKFCTGCGASHEDSEKNYFDLHPERRKKLSAQEATTNADTLKKRKQEAEVKAFEDSMKQPEPAKSGGFKPIFLIPIIIVLAIVAMMFTGRTKKDSLSIASFSWSRNISIEEMKTVEEDDWSLPDGARLIDKKEEVHHVDQVVDHTEYVTVEKSREVVDHYEEEVTGYEDNGDGSFTEVTEEVPVYTTEYYEEESEKTIYRDEPIYQTKYYYEIDVWEPIRDVFTEGEDQSPYWGDVELGTNEREGDRLEYYAFTATTSKGKEVTYELGEDSWSKLKAGDTFEIKTKGGRSVMIIDGEEISIIKQ